MATKDLNKMTAAPRRTQRVGAKSLAAEISEIERQIEAMSDLDEVDFEEDDILEDDTGLDDEFASFDDPSGLGVEVGMDDDDELDDDLVGDDVAWMDEEPGCSRMSSTRKGSEKSPGIEDEITQDYLSEVEDEAHGEELTTGDSMLDVAPTKRTAAEYVAKLKSASMRLDRVAAYLEKKGRIELAARIDKVADAIDARAKNASRRA